MKAQAEKTERESDPQEGVPERTSQTLGQEKGVSSVSENAYQSPEIERLRAENEKLTV